MTDDQENKLSMALAVQTVVNNNNSVWSGLPAFVTAFGDLETVIGDVQSIRVNQEKDTKGVTKDKGSVEADLIEKTLEVRAAVSAYATDNNDNTLKEKVNYSPSALKQARDTILRDICQLIHDESNTVISGLADYGVVAADLTELQTLIDAYNDVVAAPREAITSRSTATRELKNLIGQMDVILKDRLDMLMETFKKDHPKFHTQYTNARIIVNLGGRSTGEEPEEPQEPQVPPEPETPPTQ